MTKSQLISKHCTIVSANLVYTRQKGKNFVLESNALEYVVSSNEFSIKSLKTPPSQLFNIRYTYLKL